MTVMIPQNILALPFLQPYNVVTGSSTARTFMASTKNSIIGGRSDIMKTLFLWILD